MFNLFKQQLCILIWRLQKKTFQISVWCIGKL